MRLHLQLSGRCNLACRYCLQTDRRVRPAMDATTAEDVLDAVLGAGAPPHFVTLSGGEPFLAPALVRRVVSAVARRRSESHPIECSVLTNGTLTDEGDIDLLADHGVSLQVSFDGDATAQARRGAGTRKRVLELLSRALERQPDWARERLSAAMVVQAATVSTVARSVAEVACLGVADIRVGVLLTHDPGWGAPARAQLELQVASVVTASEHRRERTGEVAVDFLRDDPPSSPRTRERGSDALCGAPSPDSVAVDPDGRAWGCAVVASSFQRIPALALETSERLDLGHVLAPGFRRRLARGHRRAARLPLLHDKGQKWSWRGPCRACPFSGDCFVCPVATTHIPGNGDPHRVPDHQCDFQHVTLEASRRFRERSRDLGWLRSPDVWMGRSSEAP